ncbi:MAG: hypothetical protein AAAFM81_06215 [Pseudomonadota bacterium]
MTARIFSIFLVLLCTGCATGGYVAATNDTEYGYSEQAVDERTYIVRYNAKQLLNQRRIADYTLRRAAEITVASGWEWFQVLAPEESVAEIEGIEFDVLPAGIRRGPLASGLRYDPGPQSFYSLSDGEKPLDSIEILIRFVPGLKSESELVFDAKAILGERNTT